MCNCKYCMETEEENGILGDMYKDMYENKIKEISQAETDKIYNLLTPEQQTKCSY